MAFLKLELKETSRYQLQYPLSRGNEDLFITADSVLEASQQLVELAGTDQVSFTFEKAFSGMPQVVVGLVAKNGLAPIVNVYVESLTESGGVIRTSAPVDEALVAVHAIYTGA